MVNLISDSIKPRLLPDLQLLSYRNTQFLAIEVFPSPARPHYLAREGLQRGTYARVGSSNRPADAALVAEMRHYPGLMVGAPRRCSPRCRPWWEPNPLTGETELQLKPARGTR